jgi:AraC family transcriptional regulator
MQRDASGHHDVRAAEPPLRFTSRVIAEAPDWSIGDYICRAGPDERPFEERHERVTIAAVIGGSFTYRGDTGTSFLYPGSFLLGNAGKCFECGHEHGAGDRCVAIHMAPPLFEEIAAAVTGSGRFRFPVAMLPAGCGLTLPMVDIETMARDSSQIGLDEVVARLVERVLAVVSGSSGSSRALSAADQRRITNALRYIEAHAEEPLDLAGLAGVACMSKYHFLRTFRRVVGVTPYKFLLGMRLRRAAIRLRTTPAPVSTVAFEVGFGDLSTFNARFRDVFGASPRAYRTRHGRFAAQGSNIASIGTR